METNENILMLNIEFKYLRKKKSEILRKFIESLEDRSGLSISSHRNVILYPLGQVYDFTEFKRENLVIDDTDFCARIGEPEDENIRNFEGITLYGGYLRRVWGHFLLGSLGRLWPAINKEIINKIDRILFFATKDELSELTGNYLEIMELLGIADKIVIVDDEACRFEEILIPEISFEHDKFYSKECRETFDFIIRRALQGVDAQKKNRRVFFTRSRLKKCRVNEIGMREMEQYFKGRGYEIISPEVLSVKELVHILAETEVLVSFSGSVAHNILFAPNDSILRFTILERHPMINTFQANINTMLQRDCLYVDAHWLPRLAPSVGPVFLFGETPQFVRFCSDIGPYKEITSYYYDKKKNLRKYLRRYRCYFGHAEMIRTWEAAFGDLFAEAVVDTREHFGKWLSDKLPLMWYDYFNLRFLISLLRRK